MTQRFRSETLHVAAIETHCFIAATFLIYPSLTFAIALGGFTVFSIL